MDLSKRILIIDDDRVTCHLICSMLEREGFANFSYSTSGETGLEAVKELKPDIVVVDIILSGMSGYDVSKEIKKNNPDIKLILFTGNYAGVDSHKAAEVKPQYFLLKTSDFKSVIDSIKNLCK